VAEGDTILRLARRFEQTLVGETVAASAPNPRGKAAEIERLDGRRLEGVEARGKHFLLDFGELSLHSHLGMSGGWHLYRLGSRWRRPRSSAWAVL
jgi:endonuclease VIII